MAVEAWRDEGTPGLYAVITRDVGELWQELETAREGSGLVADPYGKEAQ